MKSKLYRNSNLFLRNEFKSEGILEFPFVKNQSSELDLNNLELIACSDTSKNDVLNIHKGVHFFVDDYRFESIYRNPQRSLEKYQKYRFVMTPDNSLFSEMNIWRQIESVAHSRWVGAYWQSQGMIVVPTISWAQPSSFKFCFDAVEKGSVVGVGMIGCKHRRADFMKGYNAMLDTLSPSAVICFGQPFPEMKGNIVRVDYIQSRKAMRHGR